MNDIKGEKRIDLSYSIDSDKEIAVIIMLSDNIQYKVLKLRSVMDSDSKKLIPSGTYASRELLSMLEGTLTVCTDMDHRWYRSGLCDGLWVVSVWF